MRPDQEKGTWMLTHSGRAFNFLDPDPDSIFITDIAHHLSYLCRFTGAVPVHYSVAQHSCLVADQLPKELRMAGLLHDAAEAYIGDMNAPLKSLIPRYKEIEKSIQSVIFEKFRVNPDLLSEIHHMDLRMCETEYQQLMPNHGDWDLGVEPLGINIMPWSAEVSCLQFIARYNRYKNADG